MSDSNNYLIPTITSAGLKALSRAELGSGGKITHVVLGEGPAYTPTGEETTLKALKQRVKIEDTDRQWVDKGPSGQLHIKTVVGASDFDYKIYEIGFILDGEDDPAKDVLFAVYSNIQVGMLAYKTANTELLLALDLVLALPKKETQIIAANASTGEGFSYPIATYTQAGIVSLATEEDVKDGKNSADVVTPKTLFAYLADFKKEILSFISKPKLTIIEFKADTTDIYKGESVVLSWNTSGGTRCFVENIPGIYKSQDSVSIKPVNNINDYTLICDGLSQADEVLQASATLRVYSTFINGIEKATSFAVNKSGTRLYAATNGTISVFDISTDSPKKFSSYSVADNYFNLAVKPDGTRLYAVTHNTICAFDVATDDPKKKLPDLDSNASSYWSLAVKPDGTRLYASALDNTLSVFDISTDSPKKLTAFLCAHYLSLGVKSDGSRLYAINERNLAVIDINSDTLNVLVNVDLTEYYDPKQGALGYYNLLAIKSDGTRLYVATNKTICAVDVTTDSPKILGIMGTGSYINLVIKPDDSRLYAFDLNEIISVFDISTDNPKKLSDINKKATCAVFNPDGTQLFLGVP